MGERPLSMREVPGLTSRPGFYTGLSVYFLLVIFCFISKQENIALSEVPLQFIVSFCFNYY